MLTSKQSQHGRYDRHQSFSCFPAEFSVLSTDGKNLVCPDGPQKEKIWKSLISPKSYLQYRKAERESRIILSGWFLFLCMLPFASLLYGFSFHSVFLWQGISLLLAGAGVLGRSTVEKRLAAYYGLVTRCAFCGKSLYQHDHCTGFPVRYSHVRKSVPFIILSGSCPHCGNRIIRPSSALRQNPQKSRIFATVPSQASETTPAPHPFSTQSK